jgi:hypothetical protein
VLIEREIEAKINTDQVLGLIGEKIDYLAMITADFCSTLTGDEFLYGYGAPAKVVTFLAEMNLEGLKIQVVVDDNPDKQNKYLPGSGFPIMSLSNVQQMIKEASGPVICFIFPWNLGAELLHKLSEFMPAGSKAISFFPHLSVKEF